MAAIRHIEFRVSDLKTSIAFYSALLLELGWRQVNDNGLSADGTKIYFLEMPEGAKQRKTFGPRHVCFSPESGEIVNTVAHLPILSGKILHGPAELHEEGSYMLVFKDPDGFILEVACKAEI